MTTDEAIEIGAYWAKVAMLYAESLARTELRAGRVGTAAYHDRIAAEARADIPQVIAAQEA